MRSKWVPIRHRNLIQVYAGADEVAYTNDDVFVYAPSFWERLNVKLEIK